MEKTLTARRPDESFARRTPRPRGAVAALLVASLSAYGWLYGLRLTPAVTRGTGDLIVYLASGAAVLAGQSPYTLAHWDYPPLLSFLIAPLAAMPFPQAAWIWFGVAHLCLAFAACWTWRALGRDAVALVAVAVTWALAGAIAPSLREGQINAVLVALLVLTLWAPARSGVGAVALGTAVALKLWPGILWWGLLVRRRWRQLRVSLAAAALLVVGPLVVTAALLDGPVWTRSSSYWMGTPAFLNGSLPAVALRLLDPLDPRAAALPRNWVAGNRVEGLELSAADRAASVVVAVAALAIGLGLIRRRLGPRPEAASPARVGAALLALAMVVSPICWPHYHVLQLPGTALLAAGWIRARRWPALGLLLAAWVAVGWTEAIVMGPYFRAHGAGAGAPALAWLLSTLPAVAAVGLLGLHLHGLRASDPFEAAEGGSGAAAPRVPAT